MDCQAKNGIIMCHCHVELPLVTWDSHEDLSQLPDRHPDITWPGSRGLVLSGAWLRWDCCTASDMFGSWDQQLKRYWTRWNIFELIFQSTYCLDLHIYIYIYIHIYIYIFIVAYPTSPTSPPTVEGLGERSWLPQASDWNILTEETSVIHIHISLLLILSIKTQTVIQFWGVTILFGNHSYGHSGPYLAVGCPSVAECDVYIYIYIHCKKDR